MSPYACSCTPFTARPLGSFMPAKAASHSRAVAVEHATLASDGTLRGVEVKETMEFDDKTIAVKFDEKAAVNELKAANPNTLYYFQSAEQIPASLTSNAVVGSEAETIVIQDGYLFAPLYEFKAKNISYVRNFTPRLNGKGEGWETIALPFDVQKVEANAQHSSAAG